MIAALRVILAFDLFMKDLSNTFSSHLHVVTTSEVVFCSYSDELFDVYWNSIDLATIGADVLLQLVEEILSVTVKASQSVQNLLCDGLVVLGQINVPVLIVPFRVEDLISDGMCEVIDILVGLGCLNLDCSRRICEHCC